MCYYMRLWQSHVSHHFVMQVCINYHVSEHNTHARKELPRQVLFVVYGNINAIGQNIIKMRSRNWFSCPTMGAKNVCTNCGKKHTWTWSLYNGLIWGQTSHCSSQKVHSWGSITFYLVGVWMYALRIKSLIARDQTRMKDLKVRMQD